MAVRVEDVLVVAIDQIAREEHLLDAEHFDGIDDPRGHEFDDTVVAGAFHVGLQVGDDHHGPRAGIAQLRLTESFGVRFRRSGEADRRAQDRKCC